MKSPLTAARITSALVVTALLTAAFVLLRPATISLNTPEVSHLAATLTPGEQFTEAVFRQLRFEPLPSTYSESP